MDSRRFKEICEKIISTEREQNGIGTLGEKTLHAVLKEYFEPDKAKHEKRVGSFVADIVTDNGIIEIQTGAFEKLRKKLAAFLEIYTVTVVYPIPKIKWLLWIDTQTGKMTKKRKSPKQGRIYDAIFELYKIRPFMNHINFRLCIVFVDLEEHRYLDGWNENKKKGSTLCDRVPVDISEEIYFNNKADYAKFIPVELKCRFTSKDYKSAANISLYTAQTALNIFNHIGAVKRIGKQGNLYIYGRYEKKKI